MLNYIVMLMLLLSSACQKQDDQDNNNKPNSNPDPTQYGTPFTGVPDAPNAVIYQVNMRVFSPEGDFKGVIARLDSIKNIGVNVIYLMPIYPVGVLNAINSPYCIKDYKAVNTEFGTLNDLRQLIEDAHARNMAVILDWVGNHTSWDHVWMSNANWYKRDNSGKIISPNGWTDVAQLNFDNSDMRKAMIKAMKYWVLTANCDGFRCDYSDGPPVDFWHQAIDSLRKIPSHKLLMLAEGTRAENFNAGFDFNFGFRFYEQMKNVYGNHQSVSNITATNSSEYAGANTDNRVVRYITNHDVNSSDGTPLDLFGGDKGSIAAFIVAAYMKGVPMIYNGQEVGTPFRLTFPFTNSTINWSLNPGMVAQYKKIISFYNNSNAIRKGTLTDYSNADVCAFTKTSSLETVLVVSNLRNETGTFQVPENLRSSGWKNVFTGSSVTLESTINLDAYSYVVLKK